MLHVRMAVWAVAALLNFLGYCAAAISAVVVWNLGYALLATGSGIVAAMLGLIGGACMQRCMEVVDEEIPFKPSYKGSLRV